LFHTNLKLWLNIELLIHFGIEYYDALLRAQKFANNILEKNDTLDKVILLQIVLNLHFRLRSLSTTNFYFS